MHGEPKDDAINDEVAASASVVVAQYQKKQQVTQHWLAETLGCNPTTFSNYLTGVRSFPASLVVRITNRCGLGVIQELCRACGGMFLLLPRSRSFGTGAAAYKAALDFVQHSGSAAKVFFRALEDGRITQAEHDQVKKWLNKLGESLNLLTQAFDEMPISKETDSDDCE